MPAKRQKRQRKSQKPSFGLIGGDASDWVTKNFGTGDQQWWNTFGPKSLGLNTGNLLPTVTGAPAVLPGMSAQGVNPPSQLIPSKFFKGGKKSKKSKRGGMGMLATAAVPLTLLALQQSYGTRRKGRRGSRRGSRSRKGSRRR